MNSTISHQPVPIVGVGVEVVVVPESELGPLDVYVDQLQAPLCGMDSISASEPQPNQTFKLFFFCKLRFCESMFKHEEALFKFASTFLSFYIIKVLKFETLVIGNR